MHFRTIMKSFSFYTLYILIIKIIKNKYILQVLKLYAWEMAFGEKILDIREKESEYVRKDRAIGMLMHFSWVLAPFAVSRFLHIQSFTRLDIPYMCIAAAFVRKLFRILIHK